jgi:hypothetical protein
MLELIRGTVHRIVSDGFRERWQFCWKPSSHDTGLSTTKETVINRALQMVCVCFKRLEKVFSWFSSLAFWSSHPQIPDNICVDDIIVNRLGLILVSSRDCHSFITTFIPNIYHPLPPTFGVEWVSLLLHIPETVGSSFGPETGYPNRLSWFSSILPGKLGYYRLLPHFFN